MLEVGKQYRYIRSGECVEFLGVTSNGSAYISTIHGTNYAPTCTLIEMDAPYAPIGGIVKFRHDGTTMYGKVWAYRCASRENTVYVLVQSSGMIRKIKPEDIIHLNSYQPRRFQYRGKGYFIYNDGNIYSLHGSGRQQYCTGCKDLHALRTCKRSDNAALCSHCAETGEWFFCWGCGKLHSKQEVNEVQGFYLCQKCCNTRTWVCEHCGERFLDSHTSYTSNGKQYCVECAERVLDLVTCNVCGNRVPKNETSIFARKIVCESCINNARRYAGDILPYHRPYLLDFLGNEDDLHMGVELEIDKGGEVSRKSREVYMEIGKGNAVMMRDGSLRDGFEIVSAPATYEAHKNEIRWQEAMRKAVSLGYRSHNTNTCGLHIHVDRKYFGKDRFSNYAYEDKFAMLFANNVEWIKAFSRRKVWDYCGIENAAAVKTTVEEASRGICKAKPYKGGSHQVAINYGTDKPTIEIRIFKGTLNYSTFIATLQLVQMFCEFVKFNSHADVARIRLNDFLSTAEQKGFTEFINYANRLRLAEIGVEEPNETNE